MLGLNLLIELSIGAITSAGNYSGELCYKSFGKSEIQQ